MSKEFPRAAIESLRTDQTQLDEDGVMVGVSRQAIHEVLTYLAHLNPVGRENTPQYDLREPPAPERVEYQIEDAPKPRDASPATSEQPVDDVFKFLLGEGELEGLWFGDEAPTTPSGYRRPFWWRKHLRAALSRTQSPSAGGVVEEEIARILMRSAFESWEASYKYHMDNHTEGQDGGHGAAVRFADWSEAGGRHKSLTRGVAREMARAPMSRYNLTPKGSL